MRFTATIVVLAGLLGGLFACTTAPPFNGIASVKIRHIGPAGLTETTLNKLKERELMDCLYKTAEIKENQAKVDLLQTTYLLEVRDNLGDRSFEIYTTENMKGNKGKYFINRCVYPIIRDLQ